MQSLDELVLSIRAITENPDDRVLPTGLIIRHLVHAWNVVSLDSIGKNTQEARAFLYGKVNYLAFPADCYLQHGSIFFDGWKCKLASTVSVIKSQPHTYNVSTQANPYQDLVIQLDEPIDLAFDVQVSMPDGRSQTILTPREIFDKPLPDQSVFVGNQTGFVDSAFYIVDSNVLNLRFSVSESAPPLVTYYKQEPAAYIQTVAVYRNAMVFPHGFLENPLSPKEISYKYIKEEKLPESFSYLEFRYLECAASEKIFANQNMHEESLQWAELKQNSESDLKEQNYMYYDPFYLQANQ